MSTNSVRNCIANMANQAATACVPSPEKFQQRTMRSTKSEDHHDTDGTKSLRQLLAQSSSQMYSKMALFKRIQSFEVIKPDDTDFVDEFLKSITKFEVDCPVRFPFKTNRVQFLLEKGSICKSEVFYFAKTARPVLHHKTTQLIENFLTLKRKIGSDVERKMYKHMDLIRFINRLFEKRALLFYGPNDCFILRNGIEGEGGFEKVGKNFEKHPLVLEDCLSYDEMKIASLIGISSPTAFINSCFENNRAEHEEDQFSYQIRGIAIGLPKLRFDKPNFMEFHDMIVDTDQNTSENGFGSLATVLKNPVDKLWADFYHLCFTSFPTFTEIMEGGDLSGQYTTLYDGRYFNHQIYKKRIELMAETLLLEANLRAHESEKMAFVHIPPMGFDEYPFDNEEDRPILEDFYLTSFFNVINDLKLNHISNIVFAWTPINDVKVLKERCSMNNLNIKVDFNERNPADKLMEDGKLLVTCYETSCNAALPGNNDYWLLQRRDNKSVDLISSTLVGELHNVFINNTALNGHNAKIVQICVDDV